MCWLVVGPAWRISAVHFTWWSGAMGGSSLVAALLQASQPSHAPPLALACVYLCAPCFWPPDLLLLPDPPAPSPLPSRSPPAFQTILHQPVDEWPRVDCLLAWHSQGFPLKKVQVGGGLGRSKRCLGVG